MESRKLDYFIKIVNQILVLITAGIASGVAFLQAQEISIDASKFFFYSVIAWVLSLPFGAFSYIVLANMADEEKPNFDNWVVRLPTLFTTLLFISGIILFLTGSYKQYNYKYGTSFFSEKGQASSDINVDENHKFKISTEHLSVEQKVLVEAFIQKLFPKPATGTIQNDGSRRAKPK